MFVRKAVSSTAAQPDIEMYAEGVREMRERSRVDRMDPLGWYYQSRMHGNPPGDPRAPGEPEDWSACQHGTWFFVAWHRMYLLQFERIIRSLAGEAEFALPYWDYGTALDEIAIPAAFADSDSPLFDSNRNFRPRAIARPQWADATSFSRFGGGQSEPLHRGGLPGALELNPHNPVHGIVGGDMAGFQSPLDPLFWIHHCNIDRVWDQWLRLARRTNPSEGSWARTKFSFPDPDEDGGRRELTVAQVATTPLAGYRYDDAPELDDSSELTGAPDEERAAEIDRRTRTRLADIVNPVVGESRDDDRLELLAATRRGGRVTEPFEIAPPAARGAVARVDESWTKPLYLRLENVGIDSGDASAMWNVFVQVVGQDDRHLVGTISPFGLAGLTARGGRETLTFDISDLSDVIGDRPIEVTFDAVYDDTTDEPYWERAALYTTVD